MGVPRWLKVALLVAVGLVAVAAVGLAILVSTIDLVRYVKLAADEVKTRTGRDLRIGGKVEIRLFPSLALVAEDVSFANAAWGSRPEMAKAKRVEGGVALLPLLRNEIAVTRLVLIEPDVLLETDAKGTGNWVFKPPGAAAKPPASASDDATGIDVHSVSIDRGRVIWRDGARKDTAQLAIAKLRLDRRTLGDKLDVDLAAAFRDQPFTLKGSIGTIKRLLAKDAAWPAALALAAEGTQLAVDGVLDFRTAAPTFDGTVKAEVKDATALGKLAGKPVGLPVPMLLDAKAKASSGEFTVSPMKVTIGKSTIEGKAVVKTDGARPLISAQLKSSLVDLASAAPARPAGAKAGAGGGDGRVLSADPFPLNALRTFDADAELSIGRIVTPSKLAIDKLHARAVLKAGKLEVQPFSASVGGGAVSGRLALDAARPQSATLALSLDGKGIDLQQLAAAAGHGGSVQGGRLDLAVNLAGPGESVRRFAGGSNGQVRLVVTGPARLSGAALDMGGDAFTKIADTVNPFRRTDRNTELACGVAVLPIRDGIATVPRTIAIETNRVDVVAAGTINLRTEALDLAIRPTVKEGLGLGAASLADLVRVTGTLGNPSVGIDTLASARAALSVGGAVLTGGLSLLGQTLFSRATTHSHPCKTALAGGQTSGEPRQGAAREQPKQEEGGVLDSVRRLFK